jgi:hypothetical protein
MQHFSTSLQELTRQVEQRQRQVRERLEAERKALAALKTLQRSLQEAPEAFDEEDRRAVQREAALREEALEKLQKENERRDAALKEKEAVFLQLHRTLQQRSELLDAADAETGVLTEHEELLRFFAEKQLTLAQLLSEKLQELAV